jgi:hypothetical protein
MVTVTVVPGERPEIVKENKPSGNVNPAAGDGEILLTAESVRLENPPALVAKLAIPIPVAVATLPLVGPGWKAIPTSAQSVPALRLIGKSVGEDTPEVDHSAPCAIHVPDLSEES